MIKSKNGEVKLKGSEDYIMCDFATIVEGMVDVGYDFDTIEGLVDFVKTKRQESEEVSGLDFARSILNL